MESDIYVRKIKTSSFKKEIFNARIRCLPEGNVFSHIGAHVTPMDLMKLVHLGTPRTHLFYLLASWLGFELKGPLVLYKLTLI